MAYTAAVDHGPIPDQYMDLDSADRTVRVYYTGKVSSMEDFMEVLKASVPGFRVSACQGVWRTEHFGHVYLTMKTAADKDSLLDLKCVPCGENKLYFYSYGKYMVVLRVHWLHATIRSVFLQDFFGKYGKVIEVLREYHVIDGEDVFTGVRLVKMELSGTEKEALPHIVRFGEKQSILITAPGRLPICLKCHQHGHVRAKCPKTKDNDLEIPQIPVTDSVSEKVVSADPVPPTGRGKGKRKQAESVKSSDREGKKGKTTDVAPTVEEEASSQMDNVIAAMDIPGETDVELEDNSVVDPVRSPSWAEQSSQLDAVLTVLPAPGPDVTPDTTDMLPRTESQSQEPTVCPSVTNAAEELLPLNITLCKGDKGRVTVKFPEKILEDWSEQFGFGNRTLMRDRLKAVVIADLNARKYRVLGTTSVFPIVSPLSDDEEEDDDIQ